MSDAFISLIAIQPSVPQTPKSGSAASVRGTLAVSPSAGLYSTIRQGGVKTK